MKSIIFATILFGLTQSQNVTISDPTIECFVNSTDISHQDCTNKVIIGENTEKVMCMNKYSCRGARFSITPGQSFQFEAGPFSFMYGELIVPGNVESVKCEGIDACVGTNWQLAGNMGDGFDVECLGPQACAGGTRALIYPKYIECNGMYACVETFWGIMLMPEKDEFKVKCYDMDACTYQMWQYEIPHDYRIEYEFEGWQAGMDIGIAIAAPNATSNVTATVRLNCKLGPDDTQSCNGISVFGADAKVFVDCIAYCEPGACGIITGCTIIESFKINNNKNKLSTTATTILITMFSTISVLLAIGLMVFCIYKNKKDKTHVTFEKHNENDNITDIQVEAAQQTTGADLK